MIDTYSKLPLPRPRTNRYRLGIQWIAANDEPGEHDAEVIAEQISVCLLADIYEREPIDVAHAVLRIRKGTIGE